MTVTATATITIKARTRAKAWVLIKRAGESGLVASGTPDLSARVTVEGTVRQLADFVAVVRALDLITAEMGFEALLTLVRSVQ